MKYFFMKKKQFGGFFIMMCCKQSFFKSSNLSTFEKFNEHKACFGLKFDCCNRTTTGNGRF